MSHAVEATSTLRCRAYQCQYLGCTDRGMPAGQAATVATMAKWLYPQARVRTAAPALHPGQYRVTVRVGPDDVRIFRSREAWASHVYHQIVTDAGDEQYRRPWALT